MQGVLIKFSQIAVTRIKMTEIPISVVFLNFNRIDESRITVEKLLRCTDALDNVEIIAVDNGSTDGTVEYLTGIGDRIETVLLNKNYGIEGYNRGFEIARGDIFIVLDDDSHIEINTIKRVRELFAQNKEIGLVAFKIVDKDGGRFDTWHIPAQDEYQESFAFVGCGFAIRRDIFKEIGFYPREFFLYHNEIAVAIKVRAAGYRIVYDPFCIAFHRTGGQQRDLSRRIYYTLKNSLTLIWMSYPFLTAIYLTLSRILISFSLALFHFKFEIAAKALIDFLSNKPKRMTLSKHDRYLMKPFFHQNSIIHRIFK